MDKSQDDREPAFSSSILIVDDTLSYLELLATVLTRQKYRVSRATNGYMALAMVESDPPDLILLDIRMPDLNGLEVCTWLKKNPKTCEIPVIFISAVDEAMDKVEAFSVGGVDFVNKPFELVEVLARIETHLRLRSLQLQLQKQNITLQTSAEVLSRSLEQERELSKLKSNFISLVSHEFRTPLTTIQSAAELLEHYEWSREEQIEQLHQIQSEVQHMTELMEDVLLFSKAEAGKLKLKLSPVDLCKFTVRIVKQFQLGMGRYHHINLSVHKCLDIHSGGNSEEKISRFYDDLALKSQDHINDINEDIVEAIALVDEKLLRQILTNLLTNAVKYSGKGSEIDFELTVSQDSATFLVSDRGIGIPEEDQPHLFTSFYRAHNVDNIPGTGLGLSIVKRCVDIHQGTIVMSSQLARGTTFTVVIPLHIDSLKD
ncbi:hybrid sensor histidine kinase/response regulator [Tumidithrix elongata RA019]|uniref:histidine kinase n=1 Tax=Tumidithrix elongata BACA0141 TaxID=2716417 RepID=A0AAW9Q2Y5_9CYAN|nr:hybrid sensor histidine kinase/response regulator [Tumidithrix elongata RA019]